MNKQLPVPFLIRLLKSTSNYNQWFSADALLTTKTVTRVDRNTDEIELNLATPLFYGMSGTEHRIKFIRSVFLLNKSCVTVGFKLVE